MILNKQVNMVLHKIKQKCPLYESNGNIVCGGGGGGGGGEKKEEEVDDADEDDDDNVDANHHRCRRTRMR